jgi:hypothetical protein
MLFGKGGEKIAGWTDYNSTSKGVFAIKRGSGWTLEMAEQAFKEHFQGETK